MNRDLDFYNMSSMFFSEGLPFLDVLNDHWAYQQGTSQERGGISRWFGYYSCLIWRRRWQPTPVLLPGKSHGRRSLVSCSPWGREESDTTERLPFTFTFMHWRSKWQCTPVFLPGESQRWRSLVVCCLWGRTVGHNWSDLAAAAAWLFLQVRNTETLNYLSSGRKLWL